MDIIYSKNLTTHKKHLENGNVLVLGSPGSGKTRGYILPNLLNATGENNIICLDPKGELFDSTVETLKSKGYQCRKINFYDTTNSELRFNPFNYIDKNQDDILRVSRLLVSETFAHDKFWELSAQTLCNALISYLCYYAPKHQQSLNSICKLARVYNNVEGSNEPSKLEKIFDEVAAKDPQSWSLSQFRNVHTGASRTRASIVISLLSEFNFLTEDIVKLTSEDNLELDKFCDGDQPQAIFIQINDIDRSKDKLAALFLSCVVQYLYKQADQSPRHHLNRTTCFYLDDYGIVSKAFPNLADILAGARGRNIAFPGIVLQSLSQLDKQKDTVLNSCSDIIYMGTNDIDTAFYLSQRVNIPVSEVLQLDNHKMYVLQQGKKPVVDDKYDLNDHPVFKRRDESFEKEI